jgi:hypothetical protein
MKCFLVHFNVHTPIQTVFLDNLENGGSSFKNETLHKERGPNIGKKTLESCDVQNFDNQVNAVVGAHIKE